MEAMFTKLYLNQIRLITEAIHAPDVEYLADLLFEIREQKGRLFILGVGGSAGTASHAVNDFRKICNIETYSPVDNVSELTARTNDNGWDTVFEEWLRTSRINQKDGLLIFSVGGGSVDKNISVNIVNACGYAKMMNAKILGVVGRDGGIVKKMSDVSVVIPPLFDNMITPHTEEFHSIILHLLVSHPLLKENTTKWESTR